MDSLIFQHIDSLGLATYLLIFLGMIIEGEGVILISVFLTSQGYLEFPFLIPVFIVGACLGDTLWFRFGTAIAVKMPRLYAKISRFASPIDHFLKQRPFQTLLVAKFAYGLNKFTITRAGAIEDFTLKRFIYMNIIVILIWLAVIISLGIGFSKSFEALRHYFKYAELAILVAIFVLFGITHIVRKLAIRKMEKLNGLSS